MKLQSGVLFKKSGQLMKGENKRLHLNKNDNNVVGFINARKKRKKDSKKRHFHRDNGARVFESLLNK